MRDLRARPLQSALTLAAGVLVAKVTLAVVLNYRVYLPPDFGSDFLRGREGYFWGPYHLAFYVHIASGPVALLLGLILIGERFRLRFPAWHRALGRVQVPWVLLLVVPSGLWMAYYTAAGPVGAAGLAALAVATGACAGLGWRSAIRRRFADHRRWMWRTFLLLGSAVVLRVIGGLATVLGVDVAWFDPLAIWISWLAPLAAFEGIELARRRAIRPPARAALPSRGR